MTNPEAREIGRRALVKRRLRLRLIRRRVLAGAVATFAGVWGVIFAEVATGHDPALSASSKKTPTHRTTTHRSASATSSSSASSTPAPVTTSQS